MEGDRDAAALAGLVALREACRGAPEGRRERPRRGAPLHLEQQAALFAGLQRTVTRIEKPRLLEGTAAGELDGTGTWHLSESGGVVTVRYDWRVRTTKPWMRFVAPLARPVFAWNHHGVMRAGGEGLARRLGTVLLAAGPA